MNTLSDFSCEYVELLLKLKYTLRYINLLIASILVSLARVITMLFPL